MKILRDNIMIFLSQILIGNVFLSKISFFGNIMSVYANTIINLIISIPLFVYWHQQNHKTKFSFFYMPFLYTFALLLFFEAFLRDRYITQFAGLMTTFLLVFVFGVIIPKVLPVNDFLKTLKITIIFLIICSFLFDLFHLGVTFIGGRFAGIFRDPIIMTQVASIGFAIYSAECFTFKSTVGLISNLTGLLILGSALFLTGTRSSFLIGLIGLILFLMFSVKPRTFIWTKIKFSVVVGILFIGIVALPAVNSIVTGKSSFGLRVGSTNAVDDRIRHWGYGLKRIEQSPVLGEGVLSKYYDTEGKISYENFAETHDPHNIFIYSGQVGGIPLMVLISIGYLMLVLSVIKGMLRGDQYKKITSLIILVHLPIFFIGGSMISIGSLFDRLLWLTIGYLMLRPFSENKITIERFGFIPVNR